MRIKRFMLGAATISLAAALAACSGGADTNSSSSADSSTASSKGADADNTAAFPVTIKHALGETTIESEPTRVATVGWANHEVPLALGVVPVGMSKATWGDDDDNGIMPWTEDKLKELGAETPVLFDETDGVPFEQIADTKPDVILASYSGITQEDYDTLSKIAPVVAYPEIPWGTSMEDMVKLNAKAIGKAEEGEKLLADLDKQTQDALAKHPELKGAKVLFTAFGGTTEDSKIGFYNTVDPRMGFLVENGLEAPAIVAENSKDTDQFWTEVSAEKPEQFEDVDLVIAYSSGDEAADKKTLEELQAHPLKSKIPAIAEGKVVFLESGPMGAAANQSPLSIPWGIADYFDILAAGLKK